MFGGLRFRVKGVGFRVQGSMCALRLNGVRSNRALRMETSYTTS